MKRLIWLMGFALFFSCNSKENMLFGEWNVDSKFYRATYEILEHENAIKAKIIYYNDDTTIIREDKNNPQFILTNLREQKDSFVDVVSGATKTKDEEAISIKIKNKDTLIVTSYIMNKPVKELWIRTQNHK